MNVRDFSLDTLPHAGNGLLLMSWLLPLTLAVTAMLTRPRLSALTDIAYAGTVPVDAAADAAAAEAIVCASYQVAGWSSGHDSLLSRYRPACCRHQLTMACVAGRDWAGHRQAPGLTAVVLAAAEAAAAGDLPAAEAAADAAHLQAEAVSGNGAEFCTGLADAKEGHRQLRLS